MRRLSLLAVLLAAFWSSTAPAQEKPTEDPTAATSDAGVDPFEAGLVEPEMAPAGAPLAERRDRPKYDGVKKRTTFGDVVVWIPRVVLFPLYLVSEYVVRRPLGWAITGIEKNLLIPKLRHYTTIGDSDGEGVYAGVNPIFRFDTGFRFAVGLLFWAERVGGEQSEIRLGADTDFANNLTTDLQWRLGLGERLELTPRFRFAQRDDFRFHGSGPNSEQEHETRFFRRKTLGGLNAELTAPSPGIGALLETEVSRNELDCLKNDDNIDICGDDRTFGTDDDPFAVPTLLDPYSLFRATTRIYADSRKPRPQSGTGVRGEVFARFGNGLSEADISFVRVGAEASVFWDIYQQRVIGLRVTAEDTIRENNIPFPELILLGGSDLMRGFSRGRLHGGSMFVASLDYRYPIWSLADGTIFVEAGNTFHDLADLELDALRGSFGFGIRSISSRHVSFDVLVAAGTTRFDDANFGIESGRLSIGTNWGF